jgi:hypothetical protein
MNAPFLSSFKELHTFGYFLVFDPAIPMKGIGLCAELHRATHTIPGERSAFDESIPEKVHGCLFHDEIIPDGFDPFDTAGDLARRHLDIGHP